MRRLIPMALACVTLMGTASATQAADLPIPQNLPRQEQAFRDWLEWNHRTLGGAFEKVGKKDAKWDKPAREALESAARVAGKAIDPAARWEDVFAQAKRAIEAGCDDPMILFLYADSSRVPNLPEPAELDRRWAAAAKAMEQSAYPPLRRGLAFFRAGMFKAKKVNASAEDRKEATRLFDAALALLPLSTAKEDGNTDAENEWFILARDLVDGYRSLGSDLKSALGRVDGSLAKAAGSKATRLQIKGYWLIMEAWEIRGRGLANSVTEDSFRRFDEKNIEAYKTLQEAWRIDQKNWRTATMMTSLMTSLGRERPELETWFRRAMELKDSNVAACNSKLNYLDPKWHGTREEMMEFAEACRATKNWRGGITLVAVGVHMRWAMHLDQEETTKYLQSTEVWENGKAIYEEYLSHYTTDDVVRSEYAGFTYFAGRRDAAYKQFTLLGDRVVGSRNYPLEQLMQFKASVDDEAVRREQRKAEDAARSKSKEPAAPPK